MPLKWNEFRDFDSNWEYSELELITLGIIPKVYYSYWEYSWYELITFGIIPNLKIHTWNIPSMNKLFSEYYK